jgi:hypothetical protein
MALPVKIASCLGVLEYWSVGKSESPNFNLNESFHYSITPPLHHSSRLPQGGKTIETPSGGSPKPGSLGLDSLLCEVTKEILLSNTTKD